MRGIRWLLVSAVFVTVSFMLPGQSVGTVFKKDDRIHISKLHKIEDDYYGLAEAVQIDGTIDGELTILSTMCTVQGVVTRTANLVGRDIDHSGTIRGSLRAFGQTVEINGRVLGSTLASGQYVKINQSARIERDLNAYASEVVVAGVVSGNAHVAATRITITGSIGGDVELRSDDISLLPPAIIDGNLTYTSEEEMVFETEGVTVLGKIDWIPRTLQEEGEPSSPLIGFTTQLSYFLAAFLFGLIITRLFRAHAQEASIQLKSRFSVSLAAGFVSLIVLIGFLIILVIGLGTALAGRVLLSSGEAIIGSPLLIASVLVIPVASFASVAGSIILYSGSIAFGLVIGSVLLRKSQSPTLSASPLALFIGMALVTLVCSIPYVGIWLYAIITLSGAGAILLSIRECRRPSSTSPPPSVESGDQ
ncbi:MAG: polymer-forming cytoskeletal protein [Candidatus Zixiibacteriota bacterium]|nr:MAG: polymer-forming cytoskeletal protein [candidate division Zixibacteria bacterium]